METPATPAAPAADRIVMRSPKRAVMIDDLMDAVLDDSWDGPVALPARLRAGAATGGARAARRRQSVTCPTCQVTHMSTAGLLPSLTPGGRICAVCQGELAVPSAL